MTSAIASTSIAIAPPQIPHQDQDSISAASSSPVEEGTLGGGVLPNPLEQIRVERQFITSVQDDKINAALSRFLEYQLHNYLPGLKIVDIVELNLLILLRVAKDKQYKLTKSHFWCKDVGKEIDQSGWLSQIIIQIKKCFTALNLKKFDDTKTFINQIKNHFDVYKEAIPRYSRSLINKNPISAIDIICKDLITLLDSPDSSIEVLFNTMDKEQKLSTRQAIKETIVFFYQTHLLYLEYVLVMQMNMRELVSSCGKSFSKFKNDSTINVEIDGGICFCALLNWIERTSIYLEMLCRLPDFIDSPLLNDPQDSNKWHLILELNKTLDREFRKLESQREEWNKAKSEFEEERQKYFEALDCCKVNRDLNNDFEPLVQRMKTLLNPNMNQTPWCNRISNSSACAREQFQVLVQAFSAKIELLSTFDALLYKPLDIVGIPYICRLDLFCKKMTELQDQFHQSIGPESFNRSYGLVDFLIYGCAIQARLVYNYYDKLVGEGSLTETDYDALKNSIDKPVNLLHIVLCQELFLPDQAKPKVEEIVNLLRFFYGLFSDPLLAVSFLGRPLQAAAPIKQTASPDIYFKKWLSDIFKNEQPLFSWNDTKIHQLGQKSTLENLCPDTQFFRKFLEFEQIMRDFPKKVRGFLALKQDLNHLIYLVDDLYEKYDLEIGGVVEQMKQECQKFPKKWKTANNRWLNRDSLELTWHQTALYTYLLRVSPILHLKNYIKPPAQKIEIIPPKPQIEEIDYELLADEIFDEFLTEELDIIAHEQPLITVRKCQVWLEEEHLLKITPVSNQEAIEDRTRRQRLVDESIQNANTYIMGIAEQWQQDDILQKPFGFIQSVYSLSLLFLEQSLKCVFHILPIPLSPEEPHRHRTYFMRHKGPCYMPLFADHDITQFIDEIDKYLQDIGIFWDLPQGYKQHMPDWKLALSQSGRYPGTGTGEIAKDILSLTKLMKTDPTKIAPILSRAWSKGQMALEVAHSLLQLTRTIKSVT